MTKRAFLSLIIISHFFDYSFAQSFNKMTLQEAFETSTSLKRPLLIIRFDQDLIDAQNPTNDKKLDSILNIPKNKEILEKEFVVYKLNTSSEDIANKAIQKTFILDYTPNFIVFDETGNVLNFYNPIDSEDLNEEIFEALEDTIQTSKMELNRRQKLEEKYVGNTISDQEMYQLIILNSCVHIKSQEIINEYAIREGEVTNELIKIINNQEFKTQDPIVNYILKIKKPEDENWEYYKLVLIQNILEEAQISMDKEEFERAKVLQEEYNKKVIQNTSLEYSNIPLFDDKMGLEAINEKLLEENLNFYSQLNDIESIIKYGNQYASFFLKDYKRKRKEYVEKEIINGDYIFSLVIKENMDSLTLKAIEDRKNRNNLTKSLEKRYDQYTADALNRVSWIFYEQVDDKEEIKKAVKWSLQSTKLKSSSHLYDTYAHLLFKMGKLNKALESELIALELAKKEGNPIFIEEFKIEVDKLEKEMKSKKK